MMTTLPAVLDSKSFTGRFNHARTIKTMKWAAEKQYLLQILSKSDELKRCTQESIGIAMLDAAFSGLSLSPYLGHAYLIPYGSNCSFSPGYKGLLDLVYRAGTVKSVQAVLVHKGDKFDVWTEDGERKLKHVEQFPKGQEVVAAYCIAKYANGGSNIEVMDAPQLAAVEAQAQKIGGMVWRGPWKGQMQRKAVIRRASAYWPRDDGGFMEHALKVMSKYDPADPEFKPEPLLEAPGEPVVVASDDQILELHALLTDNGLDGEEADNWLMKKAEALGLGSIQALPADAVEETKESLLARIKKVMDRRYDKVNPGLFDDS
jgi:phage RecT family recombinase